MQLTDEQIQQMREYLREQPVKLAYLFGSQAGGYTTPLSDVDVGVVFEDHLNSQEQFNLRLEMMHKLGKITKSFDAVDIVPMDKASTAFRHSVISGVNLTNKDENFKRDFEYKVIRNYIANLYYQRLHTQISLDRFAEKGLS